MKLETEYLGMCKLFKYAIKSYLKNLTWHGIPWNLLQHIGQLHIQGNKTLSPSFCCFYNTLHTSLLAWPFFSVHGIPILSFSLKCIKLQINSNRSIEIIESNIGVTKIQFFEKYDLSVGFCIIPISMKSANTTYISSLVTGFQSRILERNGMKLLACIFCAA